MRRGSERAIEEEIVRCRRTVGTLPPDIRVSDGDGMKCLDRGSGRAEGQRLVASDVVAMSEHAEMHE